jgi:hypothetical protein
LGALGGFQEGLYHDFNVTGSIRIRITSLRPNMSAVLSGLFFDRA